jgi:hypothetical protein
MNGNRAETHLTITKVDGTIVPVSIPVVVTDLEIKMICGMFCTSDEFVEFIESASKEDWDRFTLSCRLGGK